MTIFKMALKRILGAPINWLFIMLFPLVFSLLITIGSDNPEVDNYWMDGGGIPIGIVDQDESFHSQTLINQLSYRFTIHILNEEDINNALTGTSVAWVLVIREGYGQNVANGVPPQLDGFLLTITSVAITGERAAQNLTQALMVLGTDDPAILALWAETSRVDVSLVGDTSINWAAVAQLTGMYGFIAMIMAFFIIRTLMEDKRHGMPERLGVLPVSPRKIMVQGTMAAFASTLIASGVLILFLNNRLGSLPNPVYLFIMLALFNLFTVALVFAVYSSIKNMGAVSAVVVMIANIFSMLGGLFWPLEMVPPFMQRVAWFTPTYWFGRGLRNISDIGFEGFFMPVMFLLGFTLVAMLLGGWRRIQAVEE